MAGLVVSFILPFFNSGAARAFDWVLVGFFAIFFLIFLIDLSSHMKSKRNTNVTLFKFIILFILLAASYILTTDAVIAALGMGVRVIGSVLQLGVFIMIVIQFLKIPPLALLNWKRQVEDIYISDKAGICLFQKSYNPASRKLDENLVSSAISSVNSILQEMTSAKEQGLSIIKKSDRTIAIFSSELVTGAIISKEENYMINDNLKHFIQTFEVIYHRILIDWNGDSRVFQPVEAIANKIFLP